MRKLFQNLLDSVLDAVDGGDLHKRRRLVARLKAVVSDLKAIASTSPKAFGDVIREHARVAQSMIDLSEQSIRVEESIRASMSYRGPSRSTPDARECERITAELDEFLRQDGPQACPKDLLN